MQRNRVKLIRMFQMITIVALVLLAVIVMLSHISIRSRASDQRVEAMRSDYLAQQKGLIKREVERVVEMINARLSRSELEAQAAVKQRVYEAFAVADNIYQKNKSTRSDHEIQQLIVEALRAIRFAQGTGYFFIVGLNGVSYLHADNPDFEGTSVLDLQDTQKQFIIRDMIDIARQPKEGFYDYHWTKPAAPGKNHKKTSYVKLFEPFDWLIGTGLYVEDVEAQIEADLLVNISNIRFGTDGYIFINRLNGDALVANGNLISGRQKLWEVFAKNPDKTRALFAQEHDAALKAGGDYIYYSISKLTEPDKEFPKSSFIYGIPALQWLVGAGVYLDNVEINIAELQTQLEQQQRVEIQRTILVTVVIIAFILFLFQLISLRLKKDLVSFVSFFDQAAEESREIDREDVRFEEFYQMADNVNSMLRDKNLMQEKLRLSEEKYRTFFDSSRVGFFRSRLSDGLYLAVNAKAAEQIGCQVEEVVGRVKTVDLFQDISQREKLLAGLKNDGYINDFEVNLVLPNGREGSYSISAKAYPDKDYMEGIAVDITERKRAQTLLKESENRFKDMAEMLPEAIFETDKKMKIVYANQRVYDLFNFTNKDSVLGMHIQDMVAPGERKKVQDNVVRRIRGEELGLVEYCGLKKGGSTFPMLVHMTPIEHDQEIVGFRGVLVDITEQKQAEEEILQLRKLESVGILAGGIAHDFNNLLAGLFGNIEMAKRYLSAEHKSYKYLDSAGMPMERAIALTQQLLTFAKGGDPIKESLSLTGIITETGNFSLRGSNVKLQCDIDLNLYLVDADKGQLSQVISNLVINGKQAMPDGGIITIKAGNIKTAEGKQVKITVQDQGIGIAPQYLDKIFDPYFSTKQQGSGLGLASCYSIINKHNGTITVESELNQGTIFTLILPAAEEPEEILNTAPDTGLSTDITTVARILVLDDEVLVQQMCGAMLEEMGHQVNYAVNGEEAISKYQAAQEKQQGYDLVICDLTIPGGMGGQEAAQQIRKINPQAKLIVSSGYATDPLMAKYSEYGFQGRVTKPYSFAELQKVVQKTLA